MNKGRLYDGLILNRVKGASGVCHAATYFQKVETLNQDFFLQREQVVTHVCMEHPPQGIILPKCSVATAGYIAQHLVKFEILMVRTWAHLKIRDLPRIIVYHEHRWQVKPLDLMN